LSQIEQLSSAHTAETLAYLGRRPYDNVYVQWLIATGQASHGSIALWRAGAAIAGVCYYGLQIVPSADDEAAFATFAERAKRARTARMIVGPRTAVEGFWSTARAFMSRPSAIRTSQPVYALDRSTLRFSRNDAEVARVTAAEVDEIVPHSAEMIVGEVGVDPRRSNPDFRGRTARIVAAGWWWRYRVDGQLAFMCNIGSATPHTAQLQGVWAPPPMRHSGFATRALGAICDHLLDEFPTLCLYVNGYNTSAIALYERVGFVRAGEFQTLLFP